MSFLLPLARVAASGISRGSVASFAAGRMSGGNKQESAPQPENPTVGDIAGTNK